MASPYSVKKSDDGKVTVEIEDGFSLKDMDPVAATEELAKARYETRKYADEQKQRANDLEQQLAQLRAAQTQPPPVAVDPQEAQLQAYLLDQNAKALGFHDAEEYKQRVQRINQFADDAEVNARVMQFQSMCPDFPNTSDAAEKMGQRATSLNLSMDNLKPLELKALHHMCIENGDYKPLTKDETQIANGNRPNPAPVLTGQNPETTGTGFNAYTDPLDKVRAELLNRMRNGGQ